MTLDDLRAWLKGLTDAEAVVPARVVLERLPESADHGARAPAPAPASTAPDRLLSVDEASVRLGMSKRWLYRNQSKLPFARKVGGAVRFEARGLDRWLAQRGTK